MNFANSPSFANQGLRPGSRLALCVVTSLALLVGDSQYGLMDRLRDGLSVVLFPIQRAVNIPLSAAQHVGDYFILQSALKAENDRLRSRELMQSARLMRLQSLEQEISQLRSLNALRRSPADDGQLAEVLYTARDPYSFKIIIDKGMDAGLKAGLPVIDERGLIGQVTRTQPLTAEVTLLIDRNHMVPVMIQRTGQRALLYGYGGGIELRYLPAIADIRPGDLLVTSGIDGTYPAGVPVAKVGRVDRPSGSAFVRVQCQSLAGVQASRYVMVLPPRGDLPPRPAAEAPPAAPKKKQAANSEDEG